MQLSYLPIRVTTGAAKLAVQLFCSFVNGWIGKHPDYVRLVPEQQRPGFGLS